MFSPWFNGKFPVSRLQLLQTMDCFYNWVKYFAPLDFRDLQMITRSRVLPEALDVKFKCHIDQRERTGY